MFCRFSGSIILGLGSTENFLKTSGLSALALHLESLKQVRTNTKCVMISVTGRDIKRGGESLEID